MLLVVDIGNTNISCGLFDRKKIVKVFKIPTTVFLFRRKIAIQKFKKIKYRNIEAIIICSVVPKAIEEINSLFKKIFLVKPIIVGKDFKVPIKNLYKNPKQVGQDRLVGAYTGYRLYGSPLILIDFGTAITFDIVSKKREYLGGIIASGVEMSLEALFRKAALLPKVELTRAPKLLIGKDTKGSILSGAYFGIGSLCDGLIKKLKSKIGNCKVVATGGYAKIISKYCKSINKVDNELILKGLKRIYNEFQNKHHHKLKKAQ